MNIDSSDVSFNTPTRSLKLYRRMSLESAKGLHPSPLSKDSSGLLKAVTPGQESIIANVCVTPPTAGKSSNIDSDSARSGRMTVASELENLSNTIDSKLDLVKRDLQFSMADIIAKSVHSERRNLKLTSSHRWTFSDTG